MSPASDELVAAIAAEAAASAEVWFPELRARQVQARVLAADARARCFLYRVELHDGRVRRPVIVKVRHSQPSLRRLDRFEGRPQLNPERTMSDHDTARREYDGLQIIVDALGAGNERFGVLRSLAWLPAQSAIVMDLVEEPTLRHALLETSRFRRGRRSRPMDETAWLNAGAWLRIFHDHETPLMLPPRTKNREQVADLYRAYSDFLVQRVGASSLLTDLTEMAAELTSAALPSDLPLSPGHGDYVANNMFVGPAGRITVFDPLPRWRVPRYQDLATLVVGIRLLPLQATTQGLALARGELARYEVAVLRGYFGSDPVPVAAVRAYQLLVLLDKWSAMVSKRPRGSLRPHLHEVRMRMANHHYQREARWLLSVLTGSDRPGRRDSGLSA